MEMEGNGPGKIWSPTQAAGATTRASILSRIRGITMSVVKDLSEGKPPTLSILKFSSYCCSTNNRRSGSSLCCCSLDLPVGEEVISLSRESNARRIDALLRVLLIIQRLLQENRHGSKRDIYYMHPSFFSEQSIVDRAINDICILIQCSRHHLNVVSVGNGLVMGWLRFLEAGRKFDCISCPSKAHSIPVHVEEITDMASVAEYILIVEKESVFQRLADDKFCDANRCIVITGRGYPDISTRR